MNPLQNTVSEQPNASLLTPLVAKYGHEDLAHRITEYTDKLGLISQLNQQLASLDPDKQEDIFSQTVQKIMLATQDYYTHIATVPEDLRRFFLLVADIKNSNDVTIEEINALIDTDINFESTPLLSSQSIRPKNYIMQIDAITNQLANLGEQTQFNVGKRGNQPVTTTVTLDMPDHMKIEGGHSLSTYDKSIINGVTSLIECGNTVFSIPMLYHAMTGKQNPTVDDQLYDDISGKLEKMRRMLLTIDITKESEAQYITGINGEELKIEDLTLEGYLLPLNKVSGVINGKKSELYQIIQHPPLYEYSKMKRQLASVSISLLGAPINNNSTTIPLKTYLLQRIEMMKNKKNSIVSYVILYNSIYQELGALEANKTKKMRIRTYTNTILDYFVEQKYIQSYSEFKKGRSITGINISL